jgi:hypothetical protein
MNIVFEDNWSRPQGHVVVPFEEDQRRMCSTSEGLHVAYRRRPGSGLVEQRKKVDLAGNPTARRRPEQEVFLLPTDVVPNVGTKSGGREEEEEMNEPRAPRGVYIVGKGGRWHRP